MKIKTNLKSGSMVADTRQEISNLSGQAGDFFHTANQQAEGVTGAVTSAVGSLRSGVANLIGLS
jgi:hypothetical protein